MRNSLIILEFKHVKSYFRDIFEYEKLASLIFIKKKDCWEYLEVAEDDTLNVTDSFHVSDDAYYDICELSMFYGVPVKNRSICPI